MRNENMTGLGPATMILTTEGEVPVEWLSRSHLVQTRDHGLQPVARVSKLVQRASHHAVCLDHGANHPEPQTPLIVAPDQRILVADPALGLHFGHDIAMCPAKDMRDAALQDQAQLFRVTLDRSFALRANGIWLEGHANDQTAVYPRLAPWEAKLLVADNRPAKRLRPSRAA